MVHQWHTNGQRAHKLTNWKQILIAIVFFFFHFSSVVFVFCLMLLQIAFVMYFLYQMLGISAIIGSTVCIVTMIPLQFLIGKKMSGNAKLTAVS